MSSESRQGAGPSPNQRRGPIAVPLLAVLAMLLTMVCVVGCDQKAVNSDESASTAGSSTTIVIWAESYYVRWGETATILEGVAIAASEPVVDPQTEPVHAGSVILYSVVAITNWGNESFRYDQADFSLSAELGFSVGGVDPSLSPREGLPLLASGVLEPGQTIWGAVPFELTPDAVPTIDRLSFIRLAPPTTWMICWSED